MEAGRLEYLTLLEETMAHPILGSPWAYACEPFAVSDHAYYVGNTWVGSYLLDTGEGLVLIDCGMPQTVYLIFESIRKLQFDPRDIRIILLTHAHYDHAGGAEAIRRYTGAELYLGKEDVPLIGHPELLLSDRIHCPDFQVDRVYEDAHPVCLGRFSVRTVHTPGHTPGARSFFFEDTSDGAMQLCGMHGGIGFNTLKREFLEAHQFPISLQKRFYEDLLSLRELPVTIALGSHPAHTRMLERRAAGKGNGNPLRDPKYWSAFLTERADAFRKEILQS